jgi:hypothetical protein
MGWILASLSMVAPFRAQKRSKMAATRDESMTDGG